MLYGAHEQENISTIKGIAKLMKEKSNRETKHVSLPYTHGFARIDWLALNHQSLGIQRYKLSTKL